MQYYTIIGAPIYQINGSNPKLKFSDPQTAVHSKELKASFTSVNLPGRIKQNIIQIMAPIYRIQYLSDTCS